MPGRCCSEDPEKRRGCITRRPNPLPLSCVNGRNNPGRTTDRIATRGPVLRAASKRSADITSRLFDKCPRLVAELPVGNIPDFVSYEARRLDDRNNTRVNIKSSSHDGKSDVDHEKEQTKKAKTRCLASDVTGGVMSDTL
jgi:hypothetical protein